MASALSLLRLLSARKTAVICARGSAVFFVSPFSLFLPSRLFTWIPQVAKYWFHKKHAFRDYTTHGKGTGIYPIDDRVKISIAGDWGTGTDEARIVAAAMETSDPDFTIHLGDVPSRRRRLCPYPSRPARTPAHPRCGHPVQRAGADAGSVSRFAGSERG